ncbi:MAG: methyltransferase domain-containing protein [Phycisphaeraceae bacterium]|nr:methyltransferase domain-containing protein [Phycisphaeraceae bacterium]
MATHSHVEKAFPESRYGGYTRHDGTIAFMNRVHALLRPGQVVVDAGCGRGRISSDPCAWRERLRDLRGENRRVIGIDIDPASATNPCITEFRLIVDPARWPVDDRSADLVLSDFVLEHVEEPLIYLSEAARVLRPGGIFAARTPNRWGYPAIASQLTPHRHKARLLAKVQANRDAADVFPTWYRCNRRRTLAAALRRAGLDPVVWTHESEPSYLAFSPTLFRIASLFHRVMPPPLRSTLFAFARRPMTAADPPPLSSSVLSTKERPSS